ncbi:MAG TPA: GatB/YqeY domain-containing protein [Gammaproteobacteria bacterium]|nr:GatB/YqeY domain-containing protein [Gammaproteobacteria bacterium]
MPLKDRITTDMKDALRAGDKPRLGVIRLMLAAIKQREVDERIQLDDTQVLAVLDKMLKQRRESIAQYAQGRRADLVAQEQAEVAVIQSYLPAQLGEAELDKLIADAIRKSAAASMRDMGKVMGLLKPQLQGRADMGAVSARIKVKLGG